MDGSQQQNNSSVQLPALFFIMMLFVITIMSVAAVKFKKPDDTYKSHNFLMPSQSLYAPSYLPSSPALIPITQNNDIQYQYTNQCNADYVSINPYPNMDLYNAKPGHLLVSFTTGTTESDALAFLKNQGATIKIDSTWKPYIEYEFKVIRGLATTYEDELKKQSFDPTIKTVTSQGESASYITVRDHTLATSPEMDAFISAHDPQDLIEAKVTSFPVAYGISVPVSQEGHWIQVLTKDCHVDSVLKKSLLQ